MLDVDEAMLDGEVLGDRRLGDKLGKGDSLVDGESLGGSFRRLGDELKMLLGDALWRLDGASVGFFLWRYGTWTERRLGARSGAHSGARSGARSGRCSEMNLGHSRST